ncbi:MAG: serine/threonine protein kinase [Opitutus sp.]|nr:serine/threonine protein kinase [Opitutus sp.]
MNPKNAAERAKEIFEQAIELASPEERAGYVKGACAGEADLLARVQVLLRAHDESGDAFLPGSPGAEVSPTVSSLPVAAIAEKPGTMIGRYKLLQAIGEGGCGTVFMAEQEEPVRRRVAVKIIKLGMDTKEVIARFEAERQALALMDHPNIAKVLDAGATEAGRPFFVMELVRGIKIPDYCDQHNLSTEERLKLFSHVCHAIQHAHQKGIIHRDIKPSNILVTVNDGVAVPKVIDFGIAKATLGRLTDKTVFTAFEQFVGTPAYMSPEQAEMSSLDIDTRSDIYSLGVLLYELLTGRTPFETKALLQAGLDEMRRQIREVEPPRPSARLSTLEKATLSTTAEHRHTDAPKLINLISGDLDWIVMRCLDKDRTRRYDTANGLAMDLQRHLNHEPVVARPVSAAYRFRKLVRRYRLVFAGAAAVAVALVLGIMVSTWQAVRANRAERTAQSEAAIAKAVNDFLVTDLLRQADSRAQADAKTAPNPDLKVREALDRAGEKVGTRFESQPLTEAAVRDAIGSAYTGIGDYAKAALHHERALQVRKRSLGAEHPSTLTAMNNLGTAYYFLGKDAEAGALYAQTLEIRKRVLGAAHPDTLESMFDLASAYSHQGKYAEAGALYTQTLELGKRVLGAEHRLTLSVMGNLAAFYGSQGKHAEFEALNTQLLEIRKRVLGAEHPNTLQSMNNLAFAYRNQGKYAEAVALYAQTLEMRKRVLGPGHPETINVMGNLGEAYSLQGRHAEAVAILAEAWEISNRVLGVENRSALFSGWLLSRAYDAQGKHAEAAALQAQTLASAKRVLGAENSLTLLVMSDLASTDEHLNDLPQAELVYREVLASRLRKEGADSTSAATARANLGRNLLAQQKFADAVPALRAALAISETKLPDGWLTFDNRNLLGGALAGQKKFVEAEPLLVSGYEGMKQREAKMGAPNKARLKEALERLVRLYTDWGQPEKAAAWQQKLDQHNQDEMERKLAADPKTK